MPSTQVHINLFGYSKDFLTQNEKDKLWEICRETAEELQEKVKSYGLSVSSVTVR